MNQWCEVDCPDCKASNYIDMGEGDEFDGGPLIGFKCWKCDVNYLLRGMDHTPVPIEQEQAEACPNPALLDHEDCEKMLDIQQRISIGDRSNAFEDLEWLVKILLGE